MKSFLQCICFSCIWVPCLFFGEESEEESLLLESEQFLYELELLEAAALDPTILENPEPEEVTTSLWGASSMVALGFADNVYKTPIGLESFYSTLELDAFYSYFPENDWYFQLYGFARWRGYEKPDTYKDEWLSYFYGFIERTDADFKLKLIATHIFSDQIFDGSTNLNIPLGSRVIGNFPSLAVEGKWTLFHSVNATLGLKATREELSFAQYNLWAYEGYWKWEWLLSPATTLTAEAYYEKSIYDTEVNRTLRGSSLFNTHLRTQIYGGELQLERTIGTPLNLSIELFGKYEWVRDNGLGYEDTDETKVSLSLMGNWQSWDFEFWAAHRREDYRYRFISFSNSNTLLRKRADFGLSLERSWQDAHTLTLHMEWERLRSLANDDNFISRIIEVGYSYSF